MRDFAAEFKDNCGFGLIANIKNEPTRQMTLDAIEALSRMIHRGAIAADGISGDGSGMLFSMPQKFMRHTAEINGYDLPKKYAVAMVFFNNEEQYAVFEDICKRNDLKILFKRNVPVDSECLGEEARLSMPIIQQLFVVSNSIMANDRFDALIYLTRKEIEHHIQLTEPEFYIASFARNSISYKGLVMPQQLKDFYLDLQEESFAVSFAVFHQRFSTNTLPKWRLAQPFRYTAHNGEINSISANRFNVEMHEPLLESDVFSSEEMDRLLPILDKGGSDSGSADNMFEFMLVNGCDFFKTARTMVPAPWQNSPHLDAKLRAFYEYSASNMAAWDGPAALAFTDGRYVACILDRNGLRPSKYIITKDDRLIISSEFGVIDLEEENIAEQGRLKSAEMIGLDLQSGKVLKNEEINDYLKDSMPYGKWINNRSTYLMEHIDGDYEDFSDYKYDDLIAKQRYHNVTNEVVQKIVNPMTFKGKEDTGSMGDDTPLACFSHVQRNFTDYFRQKFAQVTNPAIDPLREKVVMSTAIVIGAQNNILQEKSINTHRIKSMSPIFSKEKLKVLVEFGTPGTDLYDPFYEAAHFSTHFKSGLRASLKKLAKKVEKAVVEDHARIIYLDDRKLDGDNKLIPMAMTVGFVKKHLQEKQLISKVSIVCITGEVMDSHSLAVLLSYGAKAVYPYLLYASALQMLERRSKGSTIFCKKGLKSIHNALDAGLRKIMSKMGISTVSSYHNSSLFDIMGLSHEIAAECFSDSRSLIPGLEYADIEYRINKYHVAAYRSETVKKLFPLEVGSFYKYADDGEYHDYSPDVIKSIHKFSKTTEKKDYDEIKDRINGRGLKFIRDFFEFKSDRKPIPIDRVESVDKITKRFSSAAMSLGSISPEAHEAVAEAMNSIGAQSNSGEGGESTARFGTNKNSKIKQVASGRFGVTPNYLRNAEELQIKVAQGAKPGEGGQLPGAKVSPLIASLRCTIPGVTLISPPPHHDIYSIEDLAQLIFDLKQVNPTAKIGVKLVSSAGVGTIACGVAKAYADKIIISGADGGTGAAQLGSIKFAGNPWETGLTDAHQSLKGNGLRHRVELQTDGGLKTGLDVMKAAIMGAETFGFGTVILSAIGCKILRVCHLNKCSVGIATQDDYLRQYYVGTVSGIVSYLQSVAEEVREIMAELGYETLDEVIGQTKLLKVVDDEFAQKFDFSEILYEVEGDHNIQTVYYNEPFDKNEFEKEIVEEILPALKAGERIEIKRRIQNTNRSFGARISGEIAEHYGEKGYAKGMINIHLTGQAGQSLGCFNSNGVDIYLKGVSNDYVGKGMNGGMIVITSPDGSSDRCLAGNTCLYGATGGKVFIAGTVGERFAIRNSGALAVVEGTGDHPCEYMTGGTVVILGETGTNFGAGMTGGAALVYDKDISFMDKMNRELIEANRIDTYYGDEARHYLKKILNSYYRRTKSKVAGYILEHFREELRYFWLVTPKEMKAPLNPMEAD